MVVHHVDARHQSIIQNLCPQEPTIESIACRLIFFFCHFFWFSILVICEQEREKKTRWRCWDIEKARRKTKHKKKPIPTCSLWFFFFGGTHLGICFVSPILVCLKSQVYIYKYFVLFLFFFVLFVKFSFYFYFIESRVFFTLVCCYLSASNRTLLMFI